MPVGAHARIRTGGPFVTKEVLVDNFPIVLRSDRMRRLSPI